MISPHTQKMMEEGWGTQKSNFNWDIPRVPSNGEIFHAVRWGLRRWVRHFQLPIHDDELDRMLAEVRAIPSKMRQTWIAKAEKKDGDHIEALQDASSHIDKVKLDGSQTPFGQDVTDQVVIARVDKNEKALMQRPLLRTFMLMKQLYINDTDTFRVTNLTRSQLAAKFHLSYLSHYPLRFQQTGVEFTAKGLPLGMVRGKGKRYGEEGKTCTKIGHVCERLLVDTSLLPNRAMDHELGKGWSLVLEADPAPHYECFNLRHFGPRLLSDRRRLAQHPQPPPPRDALGNVTVGGSSSSTASLIERYRHRCARCDKEKDEVTNGRWDCTSMYTKANMRVADREAARTADRYRRFYRKGTVTVMKDKRLVGHPGGSPWGKHKRNVFSLQELLAYWKYEGELRYFCLGSGQDTVILEQARGCAMGGRLSRQRTSVYLGAGEARFRTSPKKQRRHNYFVDGVPFDALFTMTRFVDDACAASNIWCKECLQHLLGLFWPSMEVSEEECGNVIRMLDMTLMYHEGDWSIRHHDRTSTPLNPSTGTRAVRHAPALFVYDKVKYIRALLIGRATRVLHISGDTHRQVVEIVMNLFSELTNESNGFKWSQCIDALKGTRMPWAKLAMREVKILSALAGLAEA